MLGRWLNRENEPISAPGKGLDEPRGIRVIRQRCANLGHSDTYRVVEVAKILIWPDAPPKLFAADQFPGLFEQRQQDAYRLILQPDTSTTFVELSCAGVELEHPEPDGRVWRCFLHPAPRQSDGLHTEEISSANRLRYQIISKTGSQCSQDRPSELNVR